MGGTIGAGLKVIHVLRKPCSESTVAANVIKFGCGAVNIDGCRVRLAEGETVTAGLSNPAVRVRVVGRDLGFTGNDVEAFQQAQRESIERANTLGRWPANVILTHAPGCVRVGTRQVASPKTYVRSTGDHAGGVTGWNPEPAGAVVPCYGDAEGKETIAAYDCAHGCPVAALDAQSGNVKGAVSNGKKAGTGYKGRFRGQEQIPGYGDTGGASRFFKQVKL